MVSGKARYGMEMRCDWGQKPVTNHINENRCLEHPCDSVPGTQQTDIQDFRIRQFRSTFWIGYSDRDWSILRKKSTMTAFWGGLKSGHRHPGPKKWIYRAPLFVYCFRISMGRSRDSEKAHELKQWRWACGGVPPESFGERHDPVENSRTQVPL
jgi:hypothetical protein